MSRQRRRDTSPEILIRKALFARGLRFRVNYPVPGKGRRTIDIAFTKRKTAVFVDGCFWHGCPIHGTKPQANAKWWSAKLNSNQLRDADTSRWLADQGWLVLRFWEHDDPGDVVSVVEKALIHAPEQPLTPFEHLTRPGRPSQ